ncbi:hypothetical protein HCC61_26705 [Streptomyces sp. HNM0575]|uniref:hypothetical protein n=1 Tax=Streptomyces sp. HNM0575 TaxID=2716338 RepID=UPI00145DE7E3|nr:hypothetical protein [Streptomyces sp. HNM0575]NLU76190.1 hypothetical protein [Streptomyces sp. HNM0575]
MTTGMGSWAPPAGLDAELTATGVHFDALRLPAYLGGRVRAILGKRCGAVVRDPYGHYLYFLSERGAAADWRIPEAACAKLLGKGCWIVVPPSHRVQAGDLRWISNPTEGRLRTPARCLRDALDCAQL